MKNLLLAVFVSGTTLSMAQSTQQTITSTMNGNASNPLIWDCLCFPTPSDNIIINHNVTLDVDWYTSGNFTVNAGKTLSGNSPDRILAVTGGSAVNNGTITLGYIYHSGGTFTNIGTLNVGQSFANATGVTTTNNGTMVITDSLYIVGTLTNNNSLSAFGTANSGTFNNAASFTTGDLWNSGTVNNSGVPGLVITHDIYSSGTISNTADIHVANDFWNSENVTNNHHIVIDHTLYTGDSVQLTANFTNNGMVSIAADMYSNQTVTGTGDFCVGGTTANSGTINGTLDICDLTGGAIDLNVGTVAGTVTFCSSSCAIGVEEETEEQKVSVYPNPFDTKLTINLKGYEEGELILQNLLGQKIFSKMISGKTEIRTDELNNGVYFYTVIVEGKKVASGKILKD